MALGALPVAPALPEKPSNLPILKVLGQRPALDDGAETGPPPAAANRAETVFETTGMVLVLLIVVSAAWILIRRRL